MTSFNIEVEDIEILVLVDNPIVEVSTSGPAGPAGPPGPPGLDGDDGDPGPPGLDGADAIRGDASFTTASLANNATENGFVELTPGYRLLRIQTSAAARVRLYVTPEARTADASRPVGTDPTGDHGVMLDFVTTTGDLNWALSPTVDGFVDSEGSVPYAVTNLSGVSAVITVTLTWINTEGPGTGGVIVGSATIDHGDLTGLSDDDHPQYQKVSEKGVANGYASLDGTGKVPSAQLPSTGGVTDHGDLTGLSDDDHPQYLTQARGDARYAAIGGGGSALPGYIYLDSMPGATDDDKLTAAMAQASADTYPATILLSNRLYTFATQRTLYNGFSLQGVSGMGNAEKQSAGYRKTEVKTQVGSATWLSHSGSQVWDVTIRNIAFTGQSSSQFMGGTSVYWCMNLRDCSWTGYKSILGSQATKLLINLCLFDGWLSFNNSYNGAIHIGGSDNSLFMGMTNIDSGTSFAASGGANGQYHLWLDYVEKSTIGPIYLTCEGAWNGIRVSGPAANVGGSNLGGPNWITGAKLEGRNAGAPCNGSIVRIEGGQLILRDTWLGYGMSSPATPGHSPQDAGLVHQTSGQLLVDGCTYDRATGVAETVPFVYCAGGKARVGDIFIGSKGGTWTGLPRVDSAGGTVDADNSVTVI